MKRIAVRFYGIYQSIQTGRCINKRTKWIIKVEGETEKAIEQELRNEIEQRAPGFFEPMGPAVTWGWREA